MEMRLAVLLYLAGLYPGRGCDVLFISTVSIAAVKIVGKKAIPHQFFKPVDRAGKNENFHTC
jgi:hypothetical protein